MLEDTRASATRAGGERLRLDPSVSVLSPGRGTAIGVPEQGALAGGDVVEVRWSGSVAELDGGGVFEADPRTWGPKGWEALEGAVGGRDGGRVVLRPHARHVVSDVPGCRKVLGAEWGRGVSLLVDPMSMMTPAMLKSREAEDHLLRVLEMVGELDPGRVAGVVVAGGVVDEACGVRVVPLGAGVLEGARVVEMAKRVLPAEAAWVVCREDAGVCGGA